MSNSEGVGVYVKDSIICSIRNDLNFTSVSYESMWIEISVGINSKKSKNTLVGLIYIQKLRFLNSVKNSQISS